MHSSTIACIGYAVLSISFLFGTVVGCLLIRKLTESESRLDLADRVRALEDLIDEMDGRLDLVAAGHAAIFVDRADAPADDDDFADLVNVVGRARAHAMISERDADLLAAIDDGYVPTTEQIVRLNAATISERARVNFGQTRPHTPYDDID